MSAGWYNLLLFNYSMNPELLQKHLPKDTELDIYNDAAHASLVAFQFHNTEVFGFRWPRFTHFSEINLRFYVKHQGERGVCFIREYVPSHLIAGLARLLYNEPYKYAKMKDQVTKSIEEISAEYHLQDGPSKMRFFARAKNKPFMPASDTLEHFFKEHELGVGRDRSGNTMTYRVHHPHWNVYPVLQAEISLDAAAIYGKEFGFLSTAKPDSVVFAMGSEIQVFQKD